MKKKKLIAVAAIFVAVCSFAQNEQDPILMTIAGEPVTRSEFEYSYNKNNTEGVIDKKSIDEYVDLFINYKLKVKAAEEARLDTLPSFIYEYTSYRDKQIRPYVLTNEEVEREAHRIYDATKHRIDSMGGLVKPAHILIRVSQDASDKAYHTARAKADSLYNVLKENDFSQEVFGELAEKYSNDGGTIRTKGEMGWIRNGETLPEFNDKAFAMQVGETSKPIRTSTGLHIIQLRGRKDFYPYDEVRAELMGYLSQRGIINFLIDQKLDSLAKAQGDNVTPDMVLAQKREELEAGDSDLKYLIKEYHDGLLLYEISNDKVWERGEKDTKGLENYFKKNKAKYNWDEPRFKGIAYRTKDPADVERVKQVLKNVKFDDWNEVLRSAFNSDSIHIRVEKGIFKRGDNDIVDKYVFGIDTEIQDTKDTKDFQCRSTYGNMLKQPKSYSDVKGLVVGDYQEELEKNWVADLRKKYPVEVYEDVLATVNNH